MNASSSEAAQARPWPGALEGTPAAVVLDSAIARNRLAHALLLHGDDPVLLHETALGIADRLLNRPGAARRTAPDRHPDFFVCRPSGKSRQIRVKEDFEPFLEKIQLSAQAGERKVGVILEADRLNTATANKFLKTLEEPPPGTTLLLLTTRPNDLLPTIRSRCQRFKFRSGDRVPPHPGFLQWTADYRAWLGRLSSGPGAGDSRAYAADGLFGACGLIARFCGMLDEAAATAFEAAGLPDDMDKEEKEAVEAGIAQGIRIRMIGGIEQATRDFVKDRPPEQAARLSHPLIQSVRTLEEAAALLVYNLKPDAAIEYYFLSALRHWSAR